MTRLQENIAFLVNQNSDLTGLINDDPSAYTA